MSMLARYALAREVLRCAQDDTKKSELPQMSFRAKAAVAKNLDGSSGVRR
jgi:hypothetical protein